MPACRLVYICPTARYRWRSEIQKIIPYVTGIRTDFDPGVVINFIKSIYASYQNRDTFFEDALQMNVDLIFEAIYRYVSLGH